MLRCCGCGALGRLEDKYVLDLLCTMQGVRGSAAGPRCEARITRHGTNNSHFIEVELEREENCLTSMTSLSFLRALPSCAGSSRENRIGTKWMQVRPCVSWIPHTYIGMWKYQAPVKNRYLGEEVQQRVRKEFFDTLNPLLGAASSKENPRHLLRCSPSTQLVGLLSCLPPVVIFSHTV